MSLIKYTFALVSVVLATDTVIQAWDLAVVTPNQIQFLKNRFEEDTMTHYDLKNMVAIAYDPKTNDVYVSDAAHKSASIFRFKTTGNTAYTIVEPIVAKQQFAVQSMVFDDRTSTLYWTTGHGRTINYVRVQDKSKTSKVPLVGRVLFTFDNSELPVGIAIDTLGGYLYWTNCNHINATIERLHLDEPAKWSDHKVVVRENLFQPLDIAVDVKSNTIYWSDEREGLYYSIGSSDMDGGSQRTLIYGLHHQPFSVALDDRAVYWSDWVNNAVWTIPKNSSQGVAVQPSLVVQYEMINTPMGLITPTDNTVKVHGL